MALQKTQSVSPRVGGVQPFVDRLVQALATIDGAIACKKEVEALMALSDDELAARGLRRQEIVAQAALRHL